MICVTIVQTKDKQIRAFQVSGHAGYAESGQDIVCSAVSALTITTINALEVYTTQVFEVDQDEEDGVITVNFLDDLTHDADLLMKSLILGLKSIENEYNDEYIHVEFREVQTMLNMNLQFFAHKKGVGSTKNGRDSESKSPV